MAMVYQVMNETTQSNSPTENNNDNPAQTEYTTTEQKQLKALKHNQYIISRWSGPLLSLFSYGLILTLASAGLILMVISALVGLFFDHGLHSGFGFLTGGLFLASGFAATLWKINLALKPLYQMRQQEKAA